MRFTMISLTTVALLGGCTQVVPVAVPVVTAPAAAPSDACNSAAYQQFVGETSPAITLPAGTVVRHYRTGDPVTKDLMADRINFEYDRTGKLVRVSCG